MSVLNYHHDLFFIKQTILDHHPGPCNSYDESFIDKMETSFARALEALEKNSSRQPVVDFTKSFEDPHLYAFYRAPSRTMGLDLFDEMSTTRLSSSLIYVKMPTFYASKEMFKPVVEILDEQDHGAIVFDLRGNSGGSYFLAQGIIEALYGKKFTQAKLSLLKAAEYASWRVSVDNLKHIDVMKEMALSNKDDASVAWAFKLGSGFHGALKEGRDLFVEKNETEFEEEQMTPKYSGKVIALIDSKCSSTCLDFLDALKAISDELILVGQKSSYDCLYRETREVVLPSGEGIFGFPIKVYRDRARGAKECFTPHIDIDWTKLDDNDLKTWLCVKFSS